MRRNGTRSLRTFEQRHATKDICIYVVRTYMYTAVIKVSLSNALKRLMDQLEERILQIDQLKNASKRL